MNKLKTTKHIWRHYGEVEEICVVCGFVRAFPDGLSPKWCSGTWHGNRAIKGKLGSELREIWKS